MTYNIHAGADSDDVYDLDPIAATVRRSGASVVALQEVDRHWSARSNVDDVAAELGRRLHMHSIYSTHLDYRADPSVRATQAAETVAIMAQDAGPKILMGDMNAPAEAPELAPLHATYRDAWTAGRGAGRT